MSQPRSIFSPLTIPLKWKGRRQWRWLAKTRRDLAWWWGIYRLRYSWSRLLGDFGSLTWVLCLAILSFLFISHFLFQTVQVQGSSMYPTLLNTNFYWLNRLAYEMGEPKRGDIVAIKDPSGNGFDVKRIIGTPGESIYIHDGKVFVNRKILLEWYLPRKVPTYAYEKSENEFWVLAPGQYFVMGDNRGNSCDSRSFGAIKRDAILGRIIW